MKQNDVVASFQSLKPGYHTGECGHEWKARSSQNKKCPFCFGRAVLPGFNDMATTHPDLAAQWHPTKNGDLTPNKIKAAGDRKIWWLCDKDHEWETPIYVRVRGHGCRLCSLPDTYEDNFQKFQAMKEKLKAQWHPTKNIESFDSLTQGSKKEVTWICDKGHDYVTSLQSRLRGYSCSYCAGNAVLMGFNDFGTLNPVKAKEWHPTKNHQLTPFQVTANSTTVVWWLGKCGHEWESAVKSRNRGHGCPICSGNQTLLGFNDLKTTHPELVSQWHPTKNGNLKPEDVRFGQNLKVWWLGKCGHECFTLIRDRLRGYGCSTCGNGILKSEAEKKIAAYLQELGLDLDTSNTTVLNGKELDIYIPNKKIAIEYNGLYWHSEDKGKHQKYHYEKWLECKKQGIQLIQIWEDDWNRNNDLILKSLEIKLNSHQGAKLFARKTNVISLTTEQSRTFLNKNHIQGFASGSYYLGLQYEDRIIASIVLKKEPDNALNIIRYATSSTVVGGFTKLLKFAEKTYKPSQFITFSDNTISNGGLYENNGFMVDRELPPDYMYVVKGERKHKFGYRLKRFKQDPELLWEEGLTEKQLAKLNNLPRIWDAGKIRWVKYC